VSTKLTNRYISGQRDVTITQLPSGSTLRQPSTYVVTWQDSFSGVSVPNYRRLIRRGADATSPAGGYRFFNKHVSGGGGYYTMDGNVVDPKDTGHVTFSGVAIPNASVPDAPSVIGLDFSSLDAAARVEFLSQVRAARTGFQGGTFLGELREALHMIRHPAQAIRTGLNVYHKVVSKRLRGVRVGRLAGRIASEAWLEYNFGWRLLAQDVRGAVNNLDHVRNFYMKVINVRKTNDFALPSTKAASSVNALQFFAWCNRTAKMAVRYKGAVSCEFSRPPSQIESWGLNTSNFVPTVYNLIPYSFVVDYFTNLGDLIDGMSLGKVNLSWGCRTLWAEGRTDVGGLQVTNPASYVPPVYRAANVSGGSITAKRSTSFSRSDVASVDVGLSDLHFHIPGFESRAWINLGALAALRTPFTS
jgi:hypothetical protein